MLSDGFKKVSPIQDSEIVSDRCLHVNSVAGLIQAIGYIKWMVANAKTDVPHGVVFRGQCENYPSMAPSLYRNISKTSTKPKKDALLRAFQESLKIPTGEPIEKYLSVESYYIEPLFQHYGIQTHWLDVVDNIWVALWFACHRCIANFKPLISFSLRPCMNHEKANIKKPKKEEFQESYCYIFLLSVPLYGEIHHSGHYISAKTEIIDLRYCIPSIYLRPHTQHGLVMRMKTKTGGTSIDFKESVEAVIRIDLSNALEWIGKDLLLSTRNLFPPPHIDTGLSLLLGIPQLRGQLDLPVA